MKKILNYLRVANAVVLCGMGTGMRRGELCALLWADVDLGKASLLVHRSIQQTKGSKLEVKDTKTDRARRISMPSSLVSELRALRKDQQERRLKQGLGRMDKDALVFPALDWTIPKPDYLTKDWIRVAKKVGIKKEFHALRHTHASQLIKAVVDIKTISSRLGHASAAMTLDVYGHLIEGADESAANAAERAFFSAQNPNVS